MDERPTSFPVDVMPSTTTTATTASTGSTLHAIPYEDTTIRSDSLSTPGASSVDSDSRSRSISTTGSSFAGGATGPGGAGDQPRASPTSSHGNKFPETGLAAKDNRKIRSEGDSSGLSLRSIPSIIVNDAASLRPSSRPDSRPSSRPDSRPGSRPSSRWSERKWGGLRTRRSAELDRPTYSVCPPSPPPPVPQMDPQFSGISLDIPTASLDGLGPQAMQFSKRGSLIKDPSQEKSGEAQSQPQPKPQPQPQPQQQPPPQQQQEQPQDEGQLERKELEQVSGPPQDDLQEQQKPAEQPKEPEQPELQGQQDKQPEATPISPASSADDQSDVQQPQFHGARPRLLKPSASLRVRRQTSIPSRAISADEDMLSRRVRLMYEKGEENVSDSEVADSMAMENGVLWEEAAETSASDAPSGAGTRRMSTVKPDRKSMLKKETNELAGGIEYWQNIGAGDVDRYGFIRHPQTSSGETTEQPNPIQRVATSLLLSSETPRRKHSIRPPSALASNRSFTGRPPTRKFSEPSIRPSSSQSTYSSPMRRSTSRFRHAANHLPHNRDRRFTDEAADMLTLPVEAVGSANGIDSAAARAMRKKEWEREDKWAKMARPSKKNKDGGGMKFEFDTQSSKLIERTWKGIPDRWRSTAWYSFLEASARKRSDSPSETELMEAYHEFQYVSSPDDVQIDIDVPRTITSHIMFRRRYRGGQRLLFRVLHAMSLYFPDTGYVQGMAALAATLLAYYDEEHTFIMLVRLWQLRGLERLYEHGFSGLMEALGDFEREWLGGGEVANNLNEVGIPPTAYGTRWYLTLFNYSIPFPAQLRVWDVFMLLGDAEPTSSHSVLPLKGSKQPQAGTFGKGLDVLHATSAALIDGMRDIILESDFENSMKVLTSWVPIKDIELFMRVAKAEWKVHHRKKFS